ncbi:MAG: Tm-1-like ATP-binding domain-containing protein [Solirubrobacterales bacterium]|nr:Tm-1-like ATP-binding domain-containing protein [Solirubrobacterales bacterium]
MDFLEDSDFVRRLERSDAGGPVVLVIGTLDTKSEEIAYLAESIVAAGGSPVLLDSSVGRGEYSSEFPLIRRETVAEASESTMELVAALPRGEAVEVMRLGVEKLTTALADSDRIDGAICIGGAGVHLAGPAFAALPLGFPKLLVSPLASGQRQFEPYVGLRDVAVMHSVADIAGINQITERIYRVAAGYITGASRVHSIGDDASRSGVGSQPAVAVSMNGNTTKALKTGRELLDQAGFGVVIFHANGVGGRALEDFVGSGTVAGVLDFTTTELGANLVGGLMDSGPDRMEGAGRMGVPQVLVPGCVDFITCGRWESAEREFPGRKLFRHNPELTLVRLSKEEMAELGSIFARKANAAKGPTSVFVPRRGFSVPDQEGGPFWDPAADEAFIEAFLSDVSPKVNTRVVDAHVNDRSFADDAVKELLVMMGGAPGNRPLAEVRPTSRTERIPSVESGSSA